MFRILTGLIPLVVTAATATMPLYFEPNQGQAHPSVEYLSRANGVTSYLTGTAAAFTVGGSQVIMRLAGAHLGKPEALNRLPGISSYFASGGHSRTRVPQFGKVRYRAVYPGIDLVYYGANGCLEYDFEIAAGADPGRIRIVYEGARGVRLDGGDLMISTAGGEMRQRRPTVYQNTNGHRRAVDASYRIDAKGVIGLKLAAYDRTRVLVVDPVLEYATYVGGSGQDSANAVKVDASGNIYIGGSVGMPATASNPFVPASSSSYDTAAAVIKYSPSQKTILYVAQIGSDGISSVGRMDVDANGALYLTGSTSSANFPLVNAAVNSNRSGGFTPFVAKVAADGQTLVYSTYFGGTGLDQFGGIVADSNGTAYVTGGAIARDFPITDESAGPFVGPKAYLAKFNGDGTLAFSHLFGGTGSTQGNGIALDSSGNIYISGATTAMDFPVKNAFQSSFRKDALLASVLGLRAAFAAKFASDGNTLVYSTLLGGTGDDVATSASADGQGNLYLAGWTTSTDLPVMNAVQKRLSGIQNGFVAELNPQGNGLVFSTYLGGSQKDAVQDLALDGNRNIYVAGSTTSADFPTMNPTSTSKPKAQAKARTAFAAKLASGGQGLVFSTLFGGSQDDGGAAIAAGASGAAYLAGTTRSSDLPVSGAFQASFGGQWDMYLAKLTPEATPAATLVALPSTVTLSMVTGSAAPDPVVINVTPANNGLPATFTASASGGNWLSISTTAGNAPGQIAVSVNPVGLGIGAYSGVVQITPTSGSAVTVPVMFRVVPQTPVLTSVTPAQFDTAHYDVLNPPATTPTVTLTIAGAGFVNGATAWVTSFIPANTVAYPATVVDANTVQVEIPRSAQATPISISVSNPGTPQSNPMNLMEGRPVIGAAGIGGTVAPGQVIVIGAFNVGPMTPFIAPKDGSVVTTLGNTQVLFDGVPAQLVAAYFSGVRAIVPASVAGKATTKIVVKYFDQSSMPLTVNVNGGFVPSIGAGVSAVLNSDGSINSPGNPASAGSIVTLVIDESQAPTGSAPLAVTIGGVSASIAPMEQVFGYPGKLQFRVKAPDGLTTASAIPVVVSFRDSDNTVLLTIAIQ